MLINKSLIILILSVLVSPMALAVGEEPSLSVIKSLVTPQQLELLIQKFQPNMKPEQRTQLSGLVQQQLNNLSPKELAQFANAKMIDMPDLVKKHISKMPASELKHIQQTLKLQKSPQP
jgi:hypothetical protein